METYTSDLIGGLDEFDSDTANDFERSHSLGRYPSSGVALNDRDELLDSWAVSVEYNYDLYAPAALPSRESDLMTPSLAAPSLLDIPQKGGTPPISDGSDGADADPLLGNSLDQPLISPISENTDVDQPLS